MVLAVGEDDDRPPLGVLPGVEGAGRGLERRAEVGPAGLDLARPERPEAPRRPRRGSRSAGTGRPPGRRRRPPPPGAPAPRRGPGAGSRPDSIATPSRSGTASSAPMLRLTLTQRTTSCPAGARGPGDRPHRGWARATTRSAIATSQPDRAIPGGRPDCPNAPHSRSRLRPPGPPRPPAGSEPPPGARAGPDGRSRSRSSASSRSVPPARADPLQGSRRSRPEDSAGRRPGGPAPAAAQGAYRSR